MKRKHYNTYVFGAMLGMTAVLAPGCSDADDIREPSSTIRVNTAGVAGASRAETSGRDNTFMVLFWREYERLEAPGAGDAEFWRKPFLASRAPQPVDFYNSITYDTNNSYPLPETSLIYATGYAPGKVLVGDATEGYRKLYSSFDSEPEHARYDFLSCDVWSGVYRGSHDDPFSQMKNRLYFRHLAAKLLFYADRDIAMENKQYVRDVQIKRLRMSIDGGATWTAMYTPDAFEWQALSPADITSSYAKVIATVSALPGNEGAGSGPAAGYKAISAETFAGADSPYVLRRENRADRVPISGMSIDSCYVCNPIVGGVVKTDRPIRLKMDISAEMSFDNNFPQPDTESTTDDLTFVRKWSDVELSAIYEVDEAGVATTTEVYEFKPGKEYRIYIRFNRSGVNLVAREIDWDYGGIHYITIPSGE